MKLTREYGEKISPEVIGLFFEDINFAADGGSLCGDDREPLRLRQRRAFGTPGNFYAVDDCGYGMDSGLQRSGRAGSRGCSL